MGQDMTNDRKMTPEEFAAKVEWEGGVTEALEYGLRENEMDDSDPAFQTAWAVLREQWDIVRPHIDKVEQILETYGEIDG